MTPSTAPTMSTGRATREVLRDPWWWVWMAVAIAWFGSWTWSDWSNESGSAGLTSATMGVVLLGTIIHRQVREKRGYDNPHWAMPPVAGAAALAIVLVVDAIEPVMSLPAMLIYAGGLAVIYAVFTYGEIYYNARRNRAAGEHPRTA